VVCFAGQGRLKLARWGAISLALTIGAIGCTRSPAARPVIAPDGMPALHVSCGSDQAGCFQLAGDMCPAGYAISPLFGSEHGNFLVRCRNAAPRHLATAPPQSQTGYAAAASRPSWQTLAAPAPGSQSPLSANDRRSPWVNTVAGDVDLGY